MLVAHTVPRSSTLVSGNPFSLSTTYPWVHLVPGSHPITLFTTRNQERMVFEVAPLFSLWHEPMVTPQSSLPPVHQWTNQQAQIRFHS